MLPHLLTGPEVVLPPAQVRWLLAQPDAVLSQMAVNRQFLEADHTFLHPSLVRALPVIQREMTHRLDSFADDIVDELRACLDELWGSPDAGDEAGGRAGDWREVRVYDTMLEVVSRLSTRVFVGLPLCRDRDFLHAARSFDRNVVLSAAALNLLPGFLKP